ncbi:sigma-54 dependent transcriptional regulator [Sphingosinicella sp. LHD-64]|uniref:sigma-54-dependent transcriptional regulator n=1 Tax=Sphingosinicella sp. LHD-64 TaxID=3072139 RepID=UPI0028104837|nr:sigma-54 dependent transcriptional regulator [Sphingosinicella sp. LHD-64]MDQ8756274.1 sigma-54 dependent transcriptional regulator [Sphingosinicella sp. LHD-64]
MTFFTDTQTVFFVDDDATLREANVQSLELAGIDVAAFGDAADALAGIGADFPGALVSDIRMPRMDGLQLFARVREIDPEIPVILITGHADVPTAIAALRDGAFDFLTKPFAADHLVASVRKALETRRLVLDNRRLRAAAEDSGDSPLIGDSPTMARLRDTIAQVAKADIDVLVEGETGTGKELVARLLHRLGPRRGKPFVAVNCGALPEALAEAELFGHEAGAGPHGRFERVGRIEASNGGTLFLDEIDSMALAVQAKMLRVLEEREILRLGAETPRVVRLRVVAAAKTDLDAAIGAGRFRSDLFYRLNVVRLRIPPLRERRADVPQLFAHFAGEAAEQVGSGRYVMSDAVRRRLVDHDWPGNVRELRNFAFSAVLDLPGQGATPASDSALALPERVGRFEASIIRESLAATGGSVAETLRLLGIPRKTLYDKMARHGIEPRDFR